jgi:hypothetical protein
VRGQARSGKEKAADGRKTDTPERDTPGLQMPMDCGRLF